MARRTLPNHYSPNTYERGGSGRISGKLKTLDLRARPVAQILGHTKASDSTVVGHKIVGVETVNLVLWGCGPDAYYLFFDDDGLSCGFPTSDMPEGVVITIPLDK